MQQSIKSEREHFEANECFSFNILCFQKCLEKLLDLIIIINANALKHLKLLTLAGISL